MDPARPTGLALTAGLIAFGLLAAALGSLTEDVIAADELAGPDDPISRYLIERRQPWLTAVVRVATYLGSSLVLVPLLLGVGLLAHRARRTWAPLWFLAITLGGASLTSTIIKLIVKRPRPTSPLVNALGYAFPSGHSTCAAAGWLPAALVLGWLTKSVGRRILLVAIALSITVLVGVSRVYLGVHAPTDVVAGWTLGGLWLTAALTAVHLHGSRRRSPAQSQDAANSPEDATAARATPSG